MIAQGDAEIPLNLLSSFPGPALSKQSLDSERIRRGLKDILLGPAQLYEALRQGGNGVSDSASVTNI